MSAPAAWAKARTQDSMSLKTWKLGVNSTQGSLYEHSCNSSRFGGSYTDHPQMIARRLIDQVNFFQIFGGCMQKIFHFKKVLI